VLLKRRGKRRFERLAAAEQIPYGSLVDARRGRVRIVADARGGKTQTAEFYAGVFRLVHRGGARPITDLVLSERPGHRKGVRTGPLTPRGEPGEAEDAGCGVTARVAFALAAAAAPPR
jgi:hypothetical protein